MLDEFQREALHQADAAELRAGVGAVLVGADEVEPAGGRGDGRGHGHDGGFVGDVDGDHRGGVAEFVGECGGAVDGDLDAAGEGDVGIGEGLWQVVGGGLDGVAVGADLGDGRDDDGHAEAGEVGATDDRGDGFETHGNFLNAGAGKNFEHFLGLDWRHADGHRRVANRA